MTRPKFRPCPACQTPNQRSRKTCSACYGSLSNKTKLKEKAASLNSEWGQGVVKNRNVGRIIDSACIAVRKLEALGYKPILFYGKPKRASNMWAADIITHLPPTTATKTLLDKMRRAYEFLLAKELPEQHVWNEDEVLSDQQLCSQERNSSPDQEDPEPPQIKEEQEELCTSQEEEQLELKQETDVFMVTLTDEESVHSRRTCAKESVGKPQIKLHRTELPQQHVCNEEEVLTDQQLCSQERNSSLDQEDPEPPQIKEEQEELHTVQEEEQLVLKQETEALMVTPTDEENDHSEDQNCNSYEILSAANKECVGNIPAINDVVPEPSSNQQLFSHNFHKAEIQNQKAGKHGDSGTTTNSETEQKKTRHSNITFKIHRDTPTGLTFYTCDACGKELKDRNTLNRHFRVHTGERPYLCNTCGRTFKDIATLKKHESIHTGEKPYPCKICGKYFRLKNDVTNHMKTHTDERPHVCNICGKRYRRKMDMKWHVRMHTREKQSCETWGSSEETLQLT